MSKPTALGAVSESLRNLLIAEMSAVPTAPVTLVSPEVSGASRRVNLFLYKSALHGSLRNLDWQSKQGDASKLVPPPLSLCLYYVLTAVSTSDPLTGESPAQALLGDAMRVFHQFPVVPADYLADDLKGAREQLRIIHEPMDVHELSTLWGTFSVPYRLSAVYQISVVQLDATSKAERPLGKRVTTVGVPEIRAPYHPPEVRSIAPVAGLAGTTLTFDGAFLDGWNAYVTMSGRVLADALSIAGDSFTVTVPPGLAAGLHELRVDIAHLYRRTFIFEVTV